MFKPAVAELHMGILNQRLQRLKGHINAHTLRADQKDADKETEELKAKEYIQKYEETDKRLVEYEDKILKLTESPC